MELIKELRANTGTGISDCKKALQESDGDLEAAYEYLRKKGLATAAKKAGRVAAEGLVAIHRLDDGRGACMVEVNSETDFVARNQEFVDLVQQVRVRVRFRFRFRFRVRLRVRVRVRVRVRQVHRAAP